MGILRLANYDIKVKQHEMDTSDDFYATAKLDIFIADLNLARDVNK